MKKNKNIKCWCYGHTHRSNRFLINETMVCSNQLGYIKLNQVDKSFHYDLVINSENKSVEFDEKVLSLVENSIFKNIYNYFFL
jgi:hypothetical protein